MLNRLDLLRETVISLRAQTLSAAEFIIVDDRSDEPAWNYLHTLPALDPRFRVLRKPDEIPRGCQSSRNLGLDACTAGAVVFLDSDDLLSPGCLHDRCEALAANPEADIVVGRQVIFSDADDSMRWVNVARPGVPDLERILAVGHPIDVPWVNGGAIFRTQSLRDQGIRWRPEFHWDDVAFHFDCLAAGLRTAWMSHDGPPDAFYRMHAGDRYGGALFTADGMSSAIRMLGWMSRSLDLMEGLTGDRRKTLALSFFQSCLLRVVDAGGYDIARELIDTALAEGVIEPRDAGILRRYCAGRKALRFSARATYYWNRLSETGMLRNYFSKRASTYGTVPVTSSRDSLQIARGR